MEWLGGEAHVRPPDGRRRFPSLRRWVASGKIPVLAGAVVTLLTTPESGLSVRNRLKRGAETAKRELDGIVGETKESWGRVCNETGEAVTRTAIKIKEAAKVTKEAVTEGGTPVPKAL